MTSGVAEGQEYIWKVSSTGERVDRFVTDRLSQVSRNRVQQLIHIGLVTVNGQETRPGQRLTVGDVVRAMVPPVEKPKLVPWAVDIPVLYEDADCVVVNKPAGMVVHPAVGHEQQTLVNALLARYPQLAAMADPETEQGRRPGIVHRLDRDTSGLLIVALHQQAREYLQRQFRERAVEKAYLALVHGWLSPSEGQIAAPIGRDPRDRKRMAVVAGGREATTIYTVRQHLLSRNGRYDLLEVRPLTGRTHQIRVHMAHVGHPIVGDAVYGRGKQRLPCPRQFLHARRLSFCRPADGQRLTFESPLPPDLAAVLQHLSPL